MRAGGQIDHPDAQIVWPCCFLPPPAHPLDLLHAPRRTTDKTLSTSSTRKLCRSLSLCANLMKSSSASKKKCALGDVVLDRRYTRWPFHFRGTYSQRGFFTQLNSSLLRYIKYSFCALFSSLKLTLPGRKSIKSICWRRWGIGGRAAALLLGQAERASFRGNGFLYFHPFKSKWGWGKSWSPVFNLAAASFPYQSPSVPQPVQKCIKYDVYIPKGIQC